MTDRDRLIELIVQANEVCSNKDCAECEYLNNDGILCDTYNIADHLLANGVIVQFFKVGGKVYFHQFDNDCKKVVVEGKIIKTSKNASECIAVLKDERNLLFSADFLGKTVFLTKEEAEAELQKRGVSNAEI